MPKVSIVLCSYNGEKYISKQIESILNQTFKDFELIICDDQSTDNTVKIISKYATIDSRVKLHLNATNLGYVKNFEKGISLATGKYIALSDQDDIWILNKIEKLQKNIQNYGLIYCDSLYVNSNLEPIGKKMSSSRRMLTTSNPLNLCFMNSVSGHAMLFKGELSKKIFPFPESIPHDWWIAFVASFNGGITYFDETLIHYRIHDNNTLASKKRSKPKNHKAINRQMIIRELYKKYPKDDEVKKVLLELNNSYKDFSIPNKLKAVFLTYKYRSKLFAIRKKKLTIIKNFILKQIHKLRLSIKE
jgi:glycosyltransferase involved in cell wall biosynthesis